MKSQKEKGGHMQCPGRPLVSIVVVTYNQQDTLRDAVESLLAQQTDFCYEILLSDDCSSDATYDICLEYQKKYPEIVKAHRNNRNLGLLRNYYDTIRRAQGKYMADCAGDDFWIDNEKLKKQVDVLESDSGITLVHTGWSIWDGEIGKMRSVDDSKRVKFLKPLTEKGELIIPILSRESSPIIHLCTAMYRRDMILDEMEKDPELFENEEYTCEDVQLEVAMSARGKIAYLPDVTLAYRIGHDSVSQGKTYGKKFRFYFGSLKLNRRLQLKYYVADNVLVSYYSRVIAYLHAQLFRRGGSADIREFLEFTAGLPWDKTWKTRLYRAILNLRKKDNRR